MRHVKLRCLSGFHEFRNLELSKERFVLEMVVKVLGLHKRMIDKEKTEMPSSLRMGKKRGSSKEAEALLKF